MTRSFLSPTLLLLLILLPAQVHAQVHASAPGERTQTREQVGPGTAATIARFLGAAIVGGWVGYVGAQVQTSDWDKSSNSELRNQRATWVAGGAVLGMVGVRLFPGLGGSQPLRPRASPPPARLVIGEDEVRSSGTTTVLQLVRAARPEWLVLRGINSWRESAVGSGEDRTLRVIPGEPTIIVYLDGMRLGGVDTMAGVPSESVTRVEFLDTHTAAVRLGGGHAHGAILLTTAMEAP
jgi:hypothetical protein